MTINTLALSPPKVKVLPSLGLSLPCIPAHICLCVLNENEAPEIYRALWQMKQMSTEITGGRGSRSREHPITRSMPICSPGFPRDTVLKSRGEWHVKLSPVRGLCRRYRDHPAAHIPSVRPTAVPSGKKQRAFKSLPGTPLSGSNN